MAVRGLGGLGLLVSTRGLLGSPITRIEVRASPERVWSLLIDQDGKVKLERSVPSDVPDLVRCLCDFGQPIHQVGLEAGTLTQHLTYGLREAGFDVVCMEARQVNAAISAIRNKTDKHGARGIALGGRVRIGALNSLLAKRLQQAVPSLLIRRTDASGQMQRPLVYVRGGPASSAPGPHTVEAVSLLEAWKASNCPCTNSAKVVGRRPSSQARTLGLPTKSWRL